MPTAMCLNLPVAFGSGSRLFASRACKLNMVYRLKPMASAELTRELYCVLVVQDHLRFHAVLPFGRFG